MAVSRKKQVELDKRRQQVAQLYLRKMNQQAIADTLGVHRSTVSRDICYLQKKWQKLAMADIEIRKSRELAELEEMERDCVMAYASNPIARWISLRLSIKVRVHTLLGLDAPSKVLIEDWRRELEEIGISPGELFDELVGRYVEALEGSEEGDAG